MRRALLTIATLLIAASTRAADIYPGKPIRMVVPYAAGAVPFIKAGRLRALGAGDQGRENPDRMNAPT